MADAPEVKVKLVVDSNADKATDDLKKGLEGVGAAAGHAGKKIDFGLKANLSSVGSLGKLALGAVAGGFAAATAAAVGLGVAGLHAFMEDSAAVKQLAGTFTMLSSDSKASFGTMKFAAKAVKDELEDMGVAIGVSDDALIEVFDNIMVRGGKSVDQAMKLTESFAQAGRALPGGAAAISEGFGNIEMGIIRARNPIVQMISATGLLKGNAKHVAAEMMKMTPEKQLELAEKAIGRMGEKMAKTPMSFGEMKTSIKGMMSQGLEAVGEPILKALSPVVARVQKFFAENRDVVNTIGEEFGATFGRVVEVAGPILDELFKQMRASSGDFKKAFADFYGPAKSLFSYIYENRTAFATTIVDVLMAIVKMGGALISAITTVRDIVISIVTKIASIVPGVGKAMGEHRMDEQIKAMRGATLAAAPGGAEAPDFAKRGEMRAEFMAAAELAGQSVEDATKLWDAATKRASDDHAATLSAAATYQNDMMAGNAQAFAQAFDVAAKAHDKGATEFVLKFLNGSDQLQDALIKAGPDIIKTGFDGLIDSLKDMGKGDVADKLRKGMARGITGEIGKSVVNNNFSGPVTIKQDFRDQDPDRIAVVFREDLARRAASRIGPRGSGPLGGPFG